MNRRTLLVSSILGFASLSASGQIKPTAATRRRPRAQEIWMRTELYFGTNRRGGEVSDDEFASFVDSEITPRFPDGLTLLTGYGQFLNSQGVLIRERSKVLILFLSGAGRGSRHEDSGDPRRIQDLVSAGVRPEGGLVSF